jgi:hypothetical protein
VVSFTPTPFYPLERAPGTHWIGGWVGPRAGLNAEDWNSDPSVVQPLASRCTDWAIPASSLWPSALLNSGTTLSLGLTFQRLWLNSTVLRAGCFGGTYRLFLQARRVDGARNHQKLDEPVSCPWRESNSIYSVVQPVTWPLQLCNTIDANCEIQDVASDLTLWSLHFI